MLQQNGPEPQEDFPRDPEPMQLVSIGDGPPQLRRVYQPRQQKCFWVYRIDWMIQGYPGPQDHLPGEWVQWKMFISGDEAEVDREVRYGPGIRIAAHGRAEPDPSRSHGVGEDEPLRIEPVGPVQKPPVQKQQQTPVDIFVDLIRDHFGNGHLPLGRETGGEAGE